MVRLGSSTNRERLRAQAARVRASHIKKPHTHTRVFLHHQMMLLNQKENKTKFLHLSIRSSPQVHNCPAPCIAPSYLVPCIFGLTACMHYAGSLAGRGGCLVHIYVYACIVLPPFLFICRWIVQFYTIQRQIKRNGGSIWYMMHTTMRGATVLATNSSLIIIKTPAICMHALQSSKDEICISKYSLVYSTE
jgi:hypothetical protein